MEGIAKKEVSPDSPEAEIIVHEAIQNALTKIGGVEAIFNVDRTDDLPFSDVHYDIWATFMQEVFRACRKCNLMGYSSIVMDKENHKVLGINFLRDGKTILVSYSE